MPRERAARPEGEKERFASGQVVVTHAEVPGSNLCGAYHPPAFVEREMGRDLELLEHLPQGAKGNPPQDQYLFRKP